MTPDKIEALQQLIGCDQAYKLIDVRGHDGKSRVEELYTNRVGCITNQIALWEWPGNRVVARMKFILAGNWNPVNLGLRTSHVESVNVQDDDKLEISTRNSVYFFSKIEVPEDKMPHTPDLIELYLSNEEEKFLKGCYFDADKNVHPLSLDLHVGMTTDSALIFFMDDVIPE